MNRSAKLRRWEKKMQTRKAPLDRQKTKDYEDGYLEAFRQMAVPLTKVPPYQPLTEEQLKTEPNTDCAQKDDTKTTPTPQRDAENDETPQRDLAAPRPLAATDRPIARSLTTKELWNALFYWMDLLADSCERSLREILQGVAVDVNERFAQAAEKGLAVRSPAPFQSLPLNVEDFRTALAEIPNEELHIYLATYNVVPPPYGAPQADTLLDQLQRMQRLSSIQQFEQDDANTRPMLPTTLGDQQTVDVANSPHF